MNDAFSPGRNTDARTTRAGDDTPLTAWLHRSLSRQYDAVLVEELPLVIAALAGKTTSEH